MTSVVEICNMALGNLGDKSTIDSLAEQSPQAQVCRLYYENARDSTLSAFNWGFAQKDATLAMTSNTPLNTYWGFEYGYPADCLRLHRIYPELNLIKTEFEIGTSVDGYKVIWASVEEAVGRYTRRVTDSAFFTPEFSYALSWRLASMIAMKQTGKADIKQAAEQQYMMAIVSARASDGAEAHIKQELNSEFIRARV